MNKIIWNTWFVCIGKNSVYKSDLANLGNIEASDLITDNNLFLHEDPYFHDYWSCSHSSIGLENIY